MVKVGVIGATGFTGEKLVELLLNHSEAELTYISAKLEKEVGFSEVYPKFIKKIGLKCKDLDLAEAANTADLLFLAVPHTVSFNLAPFLLKKKKKVIDLSADYRIHDPKIYKHFYKVSHRDKKNLDKAVYGLPEFYRDSIKDTQLLANPGCYPTVSILSLAPVIKEKCVDDIIIDAKTGVTGGGRKPSLQFHYAHLSGNMFGYKLFSHQHTPEIDQILKEISGFKTSVLFTPHIIPSERGILVTIYAKLKKAMTKKDILDLYKGQYKDEPFVRILSDRLPQLKDVVDTNFCDIGMEVRGKQLIIIGTIDNLLKGASGQAVQNMNIMLRLDEKAGL